MPPRRPRPTAASREKARRIAEALAKELVDLPAPSRRQDTLGTPDRPSVSSGARGALRCPGCLVPGMSTLERGGGVIVDHCDDCGGVWLDLGELDALTPAPAHAPKVSPAELRAAAQVPPEASGTHTVREFEYRKCPICDALMHRRNFAGSSGVVVDECPAHGVYLDPGELEAIQRFVALGGLERASRLARETFEQEQRRQERDRLSRELTPKASTSTPYDLWLRLWST